MGKQPARPQFAEATYGCGCAATDGRLVRSDGCLQQPAELSLVTERAEMQCAYQRLGDPEPSRRSCRKQLQLKRLQRRASIVAAIERGCFVDGCSPNGQRRPHD
jgi:hypothetical protein